MPSFLKQDMATLFTSLRCPASKDSSMSLVPPRQSGYSEGHTLIVRIPRQLMLFYVARDTYTLRGVTARSEDGSKVRYKFQSWIFGEPL